MRVRLASDVDYGRHEHCYDCVAGLAPFVVSLQVERWTRRYSTLIM